MEHKQPTIGIADDDTAYRIMLRANLQSEGYQIVEFTDGDEVMPYLADHQLDLLLLDMGMARMDGITTLSTLLRAGQTLPIIVLTAFSSVETAVIAMKKGAFDYIVKPIDIEELKLVIARALSFKILRDENVSLKKRLHNQFSFDNIIGDSPAMRTMFETLAMVAPTDATVLITGESGTGKELIANCLHHDSQRQQGPFIKLNCAALNENLLESELFGHEAGSFTGASARRKGRFELAHRGTLFLDEIGDMSLITQAKVLRVLQDGTFERVGGNETVSVDVRLLAATHKDLDAMITTGEFRQDLFFRLSVVPVHLPPLRERAVDIPVLANHFLKKYAEKNRKSITGFHQEVLSRLMHYSWPGNIRELENSVERAVILCQGEQITPQVLPPQFFPDTPTPADLATHRDGATLRDLEKEAIRAALHKTGNNKTQTARMLGIARQTLLNKIREYELE
ncbi:MAG: sigma-54-dependent transcriptional regulator [Desulfopila sp.]